MGPVVVSWAELARESPERLLRSAAYVAFGIWSGINVVRTAGFTWLHLTFLVLDVAFVVAGVLLLVDLRRDAVRFGPLAHLVVGAALALFGGLLLIIGGTPFGVLAVGLGLQAVINARFTRHAQRPSFPGAGDEGPLAPHTQP